MISLNEIIFCPECRGKLLENDKKYVCEKCRSSYEIISGIPVLIPHHTLQVAQKNLARYFDSKYKEDEDPWGYESSAAEKMKYNFVTDLIRKTNPNLKSILDVGCSFGYLSNKLASVSEKVIGIDVSLNALSKANHKYKKSNIVFISASATNIPFKDKKFEAVILCDGLSGMDLEGVNRDNAVRESFRVLKETGFAIFTDYLKPNQFEDYINYIQRSDYKIEKIYYMNDRLWYKLKHAFHAFRKNRIFKKILSSILVGKVLAKVSSFLGKSGSNHICILAYRK